MKFATLTLRVSAVALAAMAMMNAAKAANQPAYNPASAVAVSGVITGVRHVAAGQPLEGVHLTVKTKTETIDVYLGPADFLKMLRTSFPIGEEVDVTGSRVKFQNTPVILAREVSEDLATLTLRELDGAPVWENWGVEADPATIHE